MEENSTAIQADELEFQRVKNELGLTDKDIDFYKSEARGIWEKTYQKFKEANESEFAGRRWFWELVQNAVDSLDEPFQEVNVQLRITASDGVKTVEFTHDGGFFKRGSHIDDIDDFENFIRPGSSKQIGEHKKGGRFGSGFLSTHCLSPRIQVAGICYDMDGNKYWNETLLDRSEITKEDNLSVRISKLKIIKQLRDYQRNRDQADFNVENNPSARITFLGPINEHVLEQGLREIELSLPYVHAFNQQLKSVRIVCGETVTVYTNQNRAAGFSGFNIFATKKESSLQPEEIIHVAVKTQGHISLAWAIQKTVDGTLNFKDERARYKSLFGDEMPSLFCRYPLIGSGIFKFPVAINSIKFRPEEKRNGINLKEENPTNKEILKGAVEIYKFFLIDLSKVKSQYNIVDIFLHTDISSLPNWVDKEWYRSLLGELKGIILKYAQVQVYPLHAIRLENAIMPYLPAERVSELQLMRFFQSVKDLYPDKAPLKEHYLAWYRSIDFSILPSLKFDLPQLLEDIQSIGTLEVLAKRVNHSITWLKEVILLTIEIDQNLLTKYAVIPNQLGIFKRQGDDLFINTDIRLVEANERGILLQCYSLIKSVDFEEYLLHAEFEQISEILPNNRIKTQFDLIREIDDAIESAEDRKTSDFVSALQLLFKWLDLELDPDLVKGFKYLTKHKAELYFNTFTDDERDWAFNIAKSGKLNVLSDLAVSHLSSDDISRIVDLAKTGLDVNSIIRISGFVKAVGVDVILTSFEDITEENEDLAFKMQIGEQVEEILKQLLKIEFPHYDVLLERKRDYDIRISNPLKPGANFFIELKSVSAKSKDVVKMGIAQARKAVENINNYALIFIRRPQDEEVTTSYILNNAHCRAAIGNDVLNAVQKADVIDDIIKFESAVKLGIKDPTLKVFISQGHLKGLAGSFGQLKQNIHEAIG